MSPSLMNMLLVLLTITLLLIKADETVVDVEDGVVHEEIEEHNDFGPDWPVPTPESFAETQKMIDEAHKGDRAAFPRIVQPVSIVNFIKADGTGRKPYAAFVRQIEQLNAAFSAEEAREAGYEKATDSNIRFKLAGVRYVVNDEFFDLCQLPSVMGVYRPRYMMDPARHLNVYVCWCESNLGMAWLPYMSWFRQSTTESHYAQGAIVHHDLLPGNNFKGGLWKKGNILTHEIGHTFGLRHPYEGDCLSDESNSDQIADTPRQSGNPLSTCKAVKNRDSCKNLPGKDDIANYMVATEDSCRSHFTPGQVDYMQTVTQTYKPTLMKQQLPSCVAAVDSSDYSPDLQPCIGNVFQHNGRAWCKTDPIDPSVWAWACCPQSMDFDTETCRQGTPDFTKPAALIASPPVPTKAPVAPKPKKPKKSLRDLTTEDVQ